MAEETAVIEVAVPEALEELEALVAAKQTEYEQLHATYTDLWQRRKTATLDHGGYVAYLWTEDRMALVLKELEVLRPARDAAQVRADVAAAKAHHDAAIPDLRALAERVLHDIGTLADHLAALQGGFQDQVDQFFKFQDRRHMQAFDVQDGYIYVRQLVADLFPQDFRAPNMVDILLLTPPTEGNYQGALAACSRLKPYSQVAIDSYLTQYTEGLAHANS